MDKNLMVFLKDKNLTPKWLEELLKKTDCFQLDDIVFIDPMKASCLGSFKADMTGGFSEYVRVEDAALNVNLYILDKNVDLDMLH